MPDSIDWRWVFARYVDAVGRSGEEDFLDQVLWDVQEREQIRQLLREYGSAVYGDADALRHGEPWPLDDEHRDDGQP